MNFKQKKWFFTADKYISQIIQIIIMLMKKWCCDCKNNLKGLFFCQIDSFMHQWFFVKLIVLCITDLEHILMQSAQNIFVAVVVVVVLWDVVILYQRELGNYK
jgi:hypothetical protein